VTLRLVSGSAVFLVIAAALGAVASPGVVLAVPFAALAGLAVCAPIVAYTATLEKPDSFSALFRFGIMPMTLFTGAFFPVSQLPDWLEPVVWATPVWHGIELARNASFGTLELLPAVGHLLFLAAWIAVGTLLARRFFIRRLGV
jgi:lipooligosaccharide transport system permease protein